ncbi:MAG: metal-dependent transcriptional regulator [Planctomycetota bacterium]
MPSVTVENYLKQICLEQVRRGGDELVPMGRLAEAVGVTPGTATTMVKSLAEADLLRYAPRAGVELTASGRKLAHRVLRRHRLVELFLVEVLNMDWSEVHAEAEELEHTISDKVLDRIDELLGHPTADPHGSPIPRPDQPLLRDTSLSLDAAPIDRPLTVVRIVDHDPDFLRFAETHGLMPGASTRVTERQPHADAVSVQTEDRPVVTLGSVAAARVLVKDVE